MKVTLLWRRIEFPLMSLLRYSTRRNEDTSWSYGIWIRWRELTLRFSRMHDLMLVKCCHSSTTKITGIESRMSSATIRALGVTAWCTAFVVVGSRTHIPSLGTAGILSNIALTLPPGSSFPRTEVFFNWMASKAKHNTLLHGSIVSKLKDNTYFVGRLDVFICLSSKRDLSFHEHYFSVL